MAVTLKENSGRSRAETEGPAGRLLQSSRDPRTQDRQKTQDTCQRDNKGRTDGHLTDCIWRGGGVVWGNGGSQGAAEVSAGKKSSDPGREVEIKWRFGFILRETM